MSQPKSQLSAYTTYSYYHVVAICDSTNTAEFLATSGDPSIWEFATQSTQSPTTQQNASTQELGRYSPKCIASESNQCVGRYCILIDGSSDATYVVNQLKWFSATAEPAAPGDLNTSLAVEGMMSISEPKGVAFLDQLVNSCLSLGVNMAQAVFVIKTFFIGHNASELLDSDVPPVISDIPPLQMTLVDATGEFTEAGGEYVLEFVAVTNGQARLPQYSKAVSSMSLTAGDTLAATVSRLEAVIQRNYNEYFKCVEAQLAAQKNPGATQLLQSLARVKYKIELAPRYLDSRYTVTDQPSHFKNVAGCNQSAKFVFPPNTSIESALSDIMRHSLEVQEDAATGDPSTKIKYEYRINSTVTSTPINDSQADPLFEYTVIYRIEPFMNPKQVARNTLFESISRGELDQPNDSPEYEQIRRNIIQFDYLYTGKNIDVLDFQIKVSAGLVYLQTATLANTFKTGVERAPTTLTQPSSNDVTNMTTGLYRPGVRTQVPVFFGKHISSTDFSNTRNSESSIQHAFTLSQHASLEVAEASMRIVGNDQLLRATSAVTGPSGIRSPVPTASTDADFAYWSKAPAFVKLNIRMPRNNDDASLFAGEPDGSSDTDFTRPFWYDGFYYVISIEHDFDRGQFTQLLDMIAIQQSKNFVDGNDASDTSQEQTVSGAVEDCFSARIGCGSAPSQSPPPTTTVPSKTVPHAPSRPTELNTSDANTIVAANTSADRVKAWAAPFQGKQVSPVVKDAITRAARDKGVDLATLAAFAYNESTFIPTKVNPVSNATGLMQFLADSWRGDFLGTKDAILTPAVFANKSLRTDPYLNARAGAILLLKNASIIGSTTPGDLYLGHVFGPGGRKNNNGAWGLINADNQTNGTALATTIVSRKALTDNRIPANATVRDVRNWAANKMANAYIGGVKPAARNRPTATTNQTVPTTSAPPSTTTPNPTARDRVTIHTSCESESKKTDEVDQCNQQPSADTPPTQ